MSDMSDVSGRRPGSLVDRVLDAARWAPSGDNTQPWRFELVDDERFVVHGFDTRAHCVYDLDGHPSQIALGALLQTIEVAASALQRRVAVTRRAGLPDTTPTFDVRLLADASIEPSPWLRAVPARSVERRPMSTRALHAAAKQAAAAAAGSGYAVRWFEGPGARWRLAALMFRSAKIRLTTEEAYRVHRGVIAWGRRYSPDRVPDQALGVGALPLALMRWAMADWRRVQFMNRCAAGTWLPRIQMDWLTALRCAGHVALVAERPPQTVDDYVEAGRAVQRVWLALTLQGVQQQPEITPLIFARYHREGLAFARSAAALRRAAAVADEAAGALGGDLPRVVWLGRVGYGPAAPARSTRRRRTELLVEPAAAAQAAQAAPGSPHG